jgi:hypothetical protein
MMKPYALSHVISCHIACMEAVLVLCDCD